MANTTVEIGLGFDLLIQEGKGLVLRDSQVPPHYWKITVTAPLGVPAFVFTDLGTEIPT